MKKVLMLITLASLLLPAIAHSSITEQSDTIILISGRKIPVMVQGVSSTKISYMIPDKDGIQEIERKQVHKIAYRNGRVENFSSLALQMVDEGDWKTVILTDNKDDVEGFFALGEVEAKSSPQSRNAKAAQRSADIRLKKRAVNMGGIVVLITNRESKGGYGETPSHLVQGVVYGFDPPSE
jgi:hypothetical protein